MLTVTLANLGSKSHPVNGLEAGSGDNWVRDRWNQRASVIADGAVFTNHSLHNVWRRGNAKLGNATGNEDGPDYVIPQ